MFQMVVQRKVLLLTGDGETASAVGAALAKDRFQVERAGGGLNALAAMLDKAAFDAALVDIDSAPQQMLQALEPLIRKFPATPFVVLATDLPSDWILAAMKAGAKYYQAKSGITSELREVLDCVAPEGMNACSPGTVVTVLSAGGGCGATTLAINLADQLRLSCGTPALLVDLDTSYGAVCEYLGLKAHYGLADVLAHTDRIDAQLIRTTVLAHPSGMQVLASPVNSSFASPPAMHYEQLPWALKVFQQINEYTVVDAPRVRVDVARTLASASKVTMIVFQLNVKDVRVAQAVISALRERGVPADCLLAVASRAGNKHSMVKPDDARKVLGVAMAEICTDYRSAIRSMNLGQLLSQSAPRSPLCRDIARLAGRVHKAAGARVPAQT